MSCAGAGLNLLLISTASADALQALPARHRILPTYVLARSRGGPPVACA